MVGVYGFKIFMSFLLTPVITVYNSATNIYIYNNDPTVFESAKNFTEGYIRAWSLFLVGMFIILFVSLIKKRMKEREG